MFENPFSIKGRIRRLEYCLSYIITLICALFIQYAVKNFETIGAFALILLIPVFWFFCAQGAKRCHDRGKSGLYQLVPFYYLWLMFADGEYGENDYGSNPKGLGNPKMEDMIDGIGNFKEED